MIAKLGDFSEISKLTNVKNHIGRDIFHLFGITLGGIFFICSVYFVYLKP